VLVVLYAVRLAVGVLVVLYGVRLAEPVSRYTAQHMTCCHSTKLI